LTLFVRLPETIHPPPLGPIRPLEGRPIEAMEETILKPPLGPIRPLEGRPIEAMEATILIPPLGPIRPLEGRPIEAMELPLCIPVFHGSIGEDRPPHRWKGEGFSNDLLVPPVLFVFFQPFEFHTIILSWSSS
jgi:hypothetical protein